MRKARKLGYPREAAAWLAKECCLLMVFTCGALLFALDSRRAGRGGAVLPLSPDEPMTLENAGQAGVLPLSLLGAAGHGEIPGTARAAPGRLASRA